MTAARPSPRAAIAQASPRRRARTVTWADPLPLAVARRSQDGLSFFRAIAAGALPQPPIYSLLDFRIVGADRGAARFEGRAGEFHFDAGGSVDPGFAATRLDSACGVAVQTTLALGSGTATIRLELAYLRPIRAGDAVHAASRLVHGGKRLAWSDAELRDGAGELLVRARGRFAVFATEKAPAEPIPAPHYDSRTIEWPDPAPLGRTASSGLEKLRAIVAGTLPQPPIAHASGFRLIAAAPGEATVTCTPQVVHYNPMGGVHGGLAAILIGAGGIAAIESALAAGRRTELVNLAVEYFRPITKDTGLLTARGRVVRAGATISIADVVVTDAAGKTFARGALTAVNGADGAS